MPSSDEDAGTFPQEDRTTPRHSQQTRNRVVHPSASRTPNSDDNGIVPPSQLIAHSPDDSEEVPSSLPPVLSSHTHDLEGEQPRDREQSSSSDDDEYATAEASSSDEDDIPLASIKKNNQATKNTLSNKSTKKNTDTVRLHEVYSKIILLC